MERLEQLSRHYALPAGSAERLERLLALVATEHASITTVRDPARGADVHVADSLVALDLPEVRSAGRIADLGAGAGFPGLVLALALPKAEVVLVESVRRKAMFMQRAVDALSVSNVTVETARAESWAAGLGTCDVVTARALAQLAVVLEYAAPLLRVGGLLVAWKAGVERTEREDADAAADVLGMGEPRQVPAEPYPAVGERSLYLSSKVINTPSGYPRREGMARKRPLRASGRA